MTPLRIAPLFASVGIMCGLTACGQASEADPAWADRHLPVVPHTVDVEMANVGADLFRTNCAACHYIGGEAAGLGPNLDGVTERRTQAWIRAMIAHPDSMIDNDSIAGALYEEYGLRMLNVGVSPAEVRAIQEYIWWRDRSADAERNAGEG